MAFNVKARASRRIIVTVFSLLIFMSVLNVVMFRDGIGSENRKNSVDRNHRSYNQNIYSNLVNNLRDILNITNDENHNKNISKNLKENLKDTIVPTNKITEWKRKPYSPNAVYKPGVMGNYEPNLDRNRTGPGENNMPVLGHRNERMGLFDLDLEYGVSITNSDKISLDRVVKDIRHPECKFWHYPENLPTASVVIAFYNEGWSTLLRTVHSVINMSPEHLLKDIVLVDDCSEKENLKADLEKYMTNYSKKVKIIRNSRREGLIRSKNFGASVAEGDALVFLDAHCECSPNWLPPLLTRIAYDRTVMVAPIVDRIDWSTYQYSSSYGGLHFRGIFEWGFLYKEKPVPKKELEKRKYDSEPYWSPNNAGGLFAIDKEYFLHLGGYDPGLLIWGGENYELAFKVWQCGGSSEWVPCSRVGHIYKHHTPQRKVDIVTALPLNLINYIRVVEVWMDEYKEYFYRREPGARGYPVNITQQLQFKKDNNCGNFSWFMENVAYDIYENFPPPPPNVAWGKIGTLNNRHCLALTNQGKGKSVLGIHPCNSANIVFRLNTMGKLAVGERCLIAIDDLTVIIKKCQLGTESGAWKWDKTSGLLYNKDRDKCLTIDTNLGVYFSKCNKDNMHQQWDITEFYSWK